MKEYTIDVLGAKVRYHDLPGSGCPIVFIHGLGCASSFDYPQVASMAGIADHRRILVDLLGSGFSDKPQDFSYTIEAHADYLEQLIRHLGLDEFFIYGHSMGGAVSTNLAARFDGLGLKGLILSEANLDSGGGFFSNKIASYNEHAYLSEGHEAIFRASKADDNTQWAASLSMTSPTAVYLTSLSLVAGQSPSWRDTFYNLKAAKTFIFGLRSLPDPDLECIQRAGISIEIVADAGHSMAWENPEGLACAIIASIDRAVGKS